METFGQALRRLRGPMSIRELALLAHCGKSHVSDLERGQRTPSKQIATALDDVLGADGLLVTLSASSTPTGHAKASTTRGRPAAAADARSLATTARGAPGGLDPGRLVALEQLRRRATAGLTYGLSATSLDDWDQAVAAHGRATRHQPARLLLDELIADFAHVTEMLDRRLPPDAGRRLTRTAAQLAGLLNLTLIKLGEPAAARAWGRTARLAADQAGDSALGSWARAQDAYTIFYAGDIPHAVATAKEAQAVAGRTPCAGVALAAALEARAHALLRQRDQAEIALARAETALDALPASDAIASAFGYNEAQLRFHQGNALTHLGETERAEGAQRRALELYPDSDYLDRALVHLDRAVCLVQEGEVPEGASLAARVLQELPAERRDGIILGRARDAARHIRPGNQAHPAVRDLHELLAPVTS